MQSYASILYLRVPGNFRIILRGKDVAHHNIVNDMMYSQEVTYRPQPSAEGIHRDDVWLVKFVHKFLFPSVASLILCDQLCQMAAVVTIGFVKDAKSHIDVQGFNVYHKNRLIKVCVFCC